MSQFNSNKRGAEIHRCYPEGTGSPTMRRVLYLFPSLKLMVFQRWNMLMENNFPGFIFSLADIL